ncbi:MAG: molybdenum cofactor guanylyltransferase [Armatimonadota bacterium]|nr:molybdenum cofactor guanylyltransferase [Armatimonadota bacterium]MDR7496265.1 molybdenum cofactor guanylyltransferase [Armatimonadota bacterium]MDR7512304.1 molybdenum cofactor guanylyltransferase [Armatimonadota bacterium]
MTSSRELTGIVLAGGRSRRMGADKAFLDVGGRPIIRRVLDALAASCAYVLVVAKDPAAYAGLGVRVVTDLVPDQAPLFGLCAGLRAARSPWVFAAACDLPFLAPDAVRALAARAAGWDAVVPRANGRWHPLHAVYARAAAETLERQVAAGERGLWRAIVGLRVREVGEDELAAADPTLRTLYNVNTPEAYRAARAMAAADKERRAALPKR